MKEKLFSSNFHHQGRKEHHHSAESLDVGYGKCPEFVCVDGLIVSKEQADWRGEEEEDTEQSIISAQGTLTTLRYAFSSSSLKIIFLFSIFWQKSFPTFFSLLVIFFFPAVYLER